MKKKKIIVLIPALNEAATIAEIVAGCLAALESKELERKVIVVDDGSSDETAAKARAAGAQVVSHASNQGVGRAFRTGIEAALAAGADIIVNIDGDGQFTPSDILTLIEPIRLDQADFVSASRFKEAALVPRMPWVKKMGNRGMSWIISAITGQQFFDVSCGFRAYSRDTALQLNLWGDFTYTQETFLDLAVKGVRIAEKPIRIRGVREHGDSRVASNLWSYAGRSSRIIFHAFRDFWPMRFFGTVALIPSVPGLCLVGFLFWHRLARGGFSPYLWAGFTGGGLLGLGIMIFVVGIMAQMLKRIRLNQEMLLYYERKREYGEPNRAAP